MQLPACALPPIQPAGGRIVKRFGVHRFQPIGQLRVMDLLLRTTELPFEFRQTTPGAVDKSVRVSQWARAAVEQVATYCKGFQVCS